MLIGLVGIVLFSFGNSSITGEVVFGSGLDDGLKAYYDLEENFDDLSGNENNAVSNGTSLDEGFIENGYSFNGIDDQLIVVHSSDLGFSKTTDFTFSHWVKVNDFQLGESILAYEKCGYACAGSEHYILYSNDYPTKGILWGAINKRWESGVEISKNEWHNLVYVYDSTLNKAYIYVNGVEEASIDVSTVGLIGYNSMNLGGGSNIGFFNGTMGEIGIWNRVLNLGEIKDLYSISQDKFTQDPVEEVPEVAEEVVVEEKKTIWTWLKNLFS